MLGENFNQRENSSRPPEPPVVAGPRSSNPWKFAYPPDSTAIPSHVTQSVAPQRRVIYVPAESWKVNPVLEMTLEHPVDSLRLFFQALYDPAARDRLFVGPTHEIFSVPRRFDLSTLFVVSTAFGILFAILGHCGVTDSMKLFICFYINVVGFCQASLFGGRAPRASSVISGAIILSAFLSLVWFYDKLLLAVFMFVLNCSWAALVGYVNGTLVGSVFLITHWLRIFLTHYLERRQVRRASPALS